MPRCNTSVESSAPSEARGKPRDSPLGSEGNMRTGQEARCERFAPAAITPKLGPSRIKARKESKCEWSRSAPTQEAAKIISMGALAAALVRAWSTPLRDTDRPLLWLAGRAPGFLLEIR